MNKKVFSSAIALVLVLGGVFAALFLYQPSGQQELSEEAFRQLFSGEAPHFTEAPVAFTHRQGEGMPFVGSALVDIDTDGVDEVFVGGGEQQADVLLAFRDGGFLNILPTPEDLSQKTATLGAVSTDADDDGDTDIVIARADDLYLWINEGNSFSEAQLNLALAENTIPFSIAAGDINKDGLLDLYVSTFIDPKHFTSATFNDPDHATKNLLLMGDKEQGLIDVTAVSGINFQQNTFLSSFVDLDGDGWQDLVIAPNTDSVRVFKNLEGKTFQEQPSPTGLGFWMGLAIADLDNDGDQDLMLTNSGNTLPDFLSNGDLRKDQEKEVNWVVLTNEGDFQFSAQKLTDFEFAWGAQSADLNNDGSAELIVATNYIKWPAHKLNPSDGRILMKDSQGRWQAITQLSGALNPAYGMTPLISDFDRNGYQDIFYVNLDGASKAYLNDGGDQHFIKIIMPDTVVSLGAVVTVELADGSVQRQQFLSSTGFLSDPSRTLFFGLGGQTEISRVLIDWPTGQQTIKESPSVDSRVFIDTEASL